MSYVCAYSYVQPDKSRVEKEFTLPHTRASYALRCLDYRTAVVYNVRYVAINVKRYICTRVNE